MGIKTEQHFPLNTLCKVCEASFPGVSAFERELIVQYLVQKI